MTTAPLAIAGPRSRRGAPPRGALAPAGASVTLLLKAFQDFYAEVARQKALLLHPMGGTPPSPDAVRQHLVDLLESQAVALSRHLAEHELRLYDDAQYIMAATADEALLDLDWVGRSDWAERPLEAHLFHTHDAGERFFRKLDDVLEGRATVSTALLLVYLAALGLGFQGKFRALGARDQPEMYRRRLARHLGRMDPALLAPNQGLCPEASAHTLENAPRAELPTLRAGWVPLFAVVACLLLVAQLLWAYRVTDVNEALDRVEGVR
ncbi:DotU family type IV/VI secretion system protein [Chondromyces apiculatus]|uniref:Type IV / VI secretion system DotU domain-containing protein n=1 Tax=Chondromyces apiculatus DSM 436 TaxID=1192034 RepID=A0A017T2S2_9BACT|nr:DotU family type IV/VI secretion system protein [Chondromyces apiculatus]EYF02861.1 Hypothetical protein CAP_6441 [Chondromyces apiculatus DSM 436]